MSVLAGFAEGSLPRLSQVVGRLEKRGWLVAEWGESDNGREAKFYKLSAKGRKQLHEEESNWDRLAQAVKQIMQTAQ